MRIDYVLIPISGLKRNHLCSFACVTEQSNITSVKSSLDVASGLLNCITTFFYYYNVVYDGLESYMQKGWFCVDVRMFFYRNDLVKLIKSFRSKTLPHNPLIHPHPLPLKIKKNKHTNSKTKTNKIRIKKTHQYSCFLIFVFFSFEITVIFFLTHYKYNW